MTRRGSLAYYLAAWVYGSFFFAAARFVAAPKSLDYLLTPDTRGFLAAVFFVLAYGWLFTLGLALLLRWLAKVLQWGSALPWSVCGGALALLFALIFTFFPENLTARSGWLRFLSELFSLNSANGVPRNFQTALTVLSTALAGTATAYVLFRIDRAFAAPKETSIA